MGHIFSKMKPGKNNNDSEHEPEYDRFNILIKVLMLENEHLKKELNEKIISINIVKNKLENYINLSKNLENRLNLENSFWDNCDLKDYVKDDHNDFINSHYLHNIN